MIRKRIIRWAARVAVKNAADMRFYFEALGAAMATAYPGRTTTEHRAAIGMAAASGLHTSLPLTATPPSPSCRNCGGYHFKNGICQTCGVKQ